MALCALLLVAFAADRFGNDINDTFDTPTSQPAPEVSGPTTPEECYSLYLEGSPDTDYETFAQENCPLAGE
jgi:hypothetical protein